MTRDTDDDGPGGGGDPDDETATTGDTADQGERSATGQQADGSENANADESASEGADDGAAGMAQRGDAGDEEPFVSVTIEGEYETVFERLDHPDGFQHGELDAIVENVESTLRAVVSTGGGIRSEIYEAAEFELDDPWEIRKYLEVLVMHDLVRLQDDRWVPSEYLSQESYDGE